MKSLVLNAETSMPILGFGTWQLSGEICHGAVKKALEIGYRHIDTAEMYANEEEVGRAIAESGVQRGSPRPAVPRAYVAGEVSAS